MSSGIKVESSDQIGAERHLDDNSRHTEADEQWEDWVEESSASEKIIVGISNGESHSDIEQFISCAQSKHNIDIVQALRRATKDLHDDEKPYVWIKMINYLRTKSAAESWDESTDVGNVFEPWNDEKYLKPVLEDDELIRVNWGEILNERFDGVSPKNLVKHLSKQLDEKNDQLKHLEKALSSVVKLNKTLMEDAAVPTKTMSKKEVKNIAYDFYKNENSLCESGNLSDSSSISSGVGETKNQIDSQYFGVYSGFEIHEDMLKDNVRTKTYRDFLVDNNFLYENKIAMDVGCGTGILSLIMARNGAKKVVAIDASKIIDYASKIVQENDLDEKIVFIKSKAENIRRLPSEIGAEEKVDFIVSEWMGYGLLFEAMLPSVIIMRDRWLKEGGHIFPDTISLHVCGYNAPEYVNQKIEFWKNVYGFSMTSISKKIYKEALIGHMESHKLITDSFKFWVCDSYTVKSEDMYFKSKFELVATCNERLHVLVIYFDVNFERNTKKKSFFSTSPSSPRTHWGQTVLMLEDEIVLKIGDKIEGYISYVPNIESFRSLDVNVEFSFDPAPLHTHKVCCQNH